MIKIVPILEKNMIGDAAKYYINKDKLITKLVSHRDYDGCEIIIPLDEIKELIKYNEVY